MQRRTVALFLSTLALASGTVACGHSPEAGEKGGDDDKPSMSQPASPKPAQGEDGGEGGEN